MSDGPDIPGWAYVLGAGFGGAAVKAVADFCKVRLRQKSGDRRAASKEWGDLIDRLEKRLDATEARADSAETKADAAESRVMECERAHVECAMRLELLTSAMNEMRLRIGMQVGIAGVGDE